MLIHVVFFFVDSTQVGRGCSFVPLFQMNSLKLLAHARPIYTSLVTRVRLLWHSTALHIPVVSEVSVFQSLCTPGGILGRFNHVAIATHDLDKASKFYKDLGAKVSDPVVSDRLVLLFGPHTIEH